VEVVADPPTDAPVVDAETSPAETAPGSAPTTAETAGAPAGTVEIVLLGGRALRAPATLPTAALRRLIAWGSTGRCSSRR
ncbi:MAG: hypothetical protein R6V44_16455, partial [Paracoccaceae bacterium]